MQGSSANDTATVSRLRYQHVNAPARAPFCVFNRHVKAHDEPQHHSFDSYPTRGIHHHPKASANMAIKTVETKDGLQKQQTLGSLRLRHHETNEIILIPTPSDE